MNNADVMNKDLLSNLKWMITWLSVTWQFGMENFIFDWLLNDWFEALSYWSKKCLNIQRLGSGKSGEKVKDPSNIKRDIIEVKFQIVALYRR